MLLVTIRNNRENAQYRHEAGSLVLGRYPATQHAHVVINDDYVSRKQLLLEDLTDGRVLIENVGRSEILLPNGTSVFHGQSLTVNLPTQLQAGKTLIDIESAEDSSILTAESPSPGVSDEPYRTITPPVCHRSHPTQRHSLSNLSETPSAEELAAWFETLVSVQRSAVGSTEFYRETARAVVDLVGLDRGLVLLRKGSNWMVVVGHAKNDETALTYSQSLVSTVIQQQRTLFGNPRMLSNTSSLVDLEAVVASPIFDARGEVAGILYGSRDFNPTASRVGIKPLEAQLVQLLASSVSSGLVRLGMVERLKQAEQLAAVGQAIGYIVHDLRGPLGNIQQLVEMWEDAGQTAVSREEQKRLIDTSLAVSLDLLNDSLEFCRGNVHVERVRGTFCQLMAKHLRLLRLDADTLGVVLEIVVPDDLEVFLDPERMARVLRNLTKNACEALQGRGDAVVTVGAKKTAVGVELYIQDNGPGLPSEVQRGLFQPFESHGKRGGTGFGLAIAKQLVEAHDGTIAVESGSHGTRFTIHLPHPIDGEDVQDEATVLEKGPAAATTDESREGDNAVAVAARRILLVDDGLINQRLITRLLENAGHIVTVVSDGENAVKIFRNHFFDLVLMDVEMPVMDGLAATRIIREFEGGVDRHTPIVALTAHQSTERHSECLNAGMDAVLVKPIRGGELNRVLGQFAQQPGP